MREWATLAGRIDECRYNEVLTQLEYQAGQADVWRDAVNNWFHRASGIADTQGRVGQPSGAPSCAASHRYNGEAGWRTIRVQYFDQNNGMSRFRLLVAGQLVDEWIAPNMLKTKRIDSSSSTRRTVSGVALRPGDVIRIEGTPDGGESAALDFIEIVR